MKVNLNLLRRLSDRFGVWSISHDGLQNVIATTNNFVKAPAGFEPLITGGGYQWNDEVNGYTLGNNQKIFLTPDGKAIWVFKDVLFRALTPNSIQKWVSADDEYPMGKANAFFQIYGKLTNQDLGQNETAGDEVPDGEQDDDGGGVAAADDENALKFTKADIQKMLAGGWPDDLPSNGPSMASSIPGEEPEDPTGLSNEPSAPMKGPSPNRLKMGEPSTGGEADRIIATIYKKAKVNPKDKLSKQAPIRLTSDQIIDLYQRAKTLPPEEGKKLVAFLKSGAILQDDTFGENKMLNSQLKALLEHIVQGVVREVDGAKKKASPKGPKSPKTPQRMDWEPDAEEPQRRQPNNINKWIEGVANKLWHGPSDIGMGKSGWKVSQTREHPEGPVYLVSKSKRVEQTRLFANRNGQWFYFNPDADVNDRKWKPLGAAPETEPSIEQEQSVAAGAGPVTGPNAFKKKSKYYPLEEMTTTSGGGGSSPGTPGYNIPGAWSGGNMEKNKKHIEVLGYTLTPQGKAEMKRAGDKLYENTEKMKKCQNCGEAMGADKTRCPKCKYLNDDTPEEKKLKYGAAQLQEGCHHCNMMVVNGTPTHEQGCPAAKKTRPQICKNCSTPMERGQTRCKKCNAVQEASGLGPDF